MLTRLRSTWLAGGGALLLALSLSGVVAAAALVSAITAPPAETVVPVVVADTTATFEDADGDGIDDDCDDAIVADETAALAAEKAADLDGDGVISASEAAQSGRVGGTNCNHGGYVSNVAHAEETCEPPVVAAPVTGIEVSTEAETATEPTVDATCEEPVEDADEAAEDAEVPAECVTAPAPVVEPAVEPVVEEPVDTAPNAHGKTVAKVAQDKDAVGGKNCNHGGAVSEAAKKDQADKDAAKAARDAAKAERADKAKSQADHAKKAKSHGKKHGG